MKSIEFTENIVGSLVIDTKTKKINWHKPSSHTTKCRMKYQDIWCDKNIAICKQRGTAGIITLKISWLTTDDSTVVPGTVKLEFLHRISRKGTLVLKEKIVILENKGSDKNLTELRDLVIRNIGERRADAELSQSEKILQEFFEE